MGGMALARPLLGLVLHLPAFRRRLEEALREGPEAVVVFWGSHCGRGGLCLNGSWFL